MREELKGDREKEKESLADIPLAGKKSILESALSYIRWQMNEDLKREPLKNLQGLIYPQGYSSGVLKAQ